MQTFYYNNFINFVSSLYENSSAVDSNFGEIFVQSTIKNKYINNESKSFKNIDKMWKEIFKNRKNHYKLKI